MKTQTNGDHMNESEQNASNTIGEVGQPTPPQPSKLEQSCNTMRAQALILEQATRLLVTDKYVSGEAAAQAMLAVRHLEDARMRLGKVIQYTAGGGVSCWDSDRKPSDDGR